MTYSKIKQFFFLSLCLVWSRKIQNITEDYLQSTKIRNRRGKKGDGGGRNTFEKHPVSFYEKLKNWEGKKSWHIIVEGVKAMWLITHAKEIRYRVFIKNCAFSQLIATLSLHAGDRIMFVPGFTRLTYWLPPISKQPITAQYTGEGEVAKFWKFFEKNTIFNEHPVY